MKRAIQILFAAVMLHTCMARAQEIGDTINVKGVNAQILTIDDYGNGIAVKKIDGAFCISSDIVSTFPSNSASDGKRNTAALIKYIADNDYGLANFPALKKLKDMGGDWYIPGSDELKEAIVESIQVDWDVEDDLDYTQGYIRFTSPLAIYNMMVQSSTISGGKAIARKYYNPTSIHNVIGQSKAACYAFCPFSTGKPRVRREKDQSAETPKVVSTTSPTNNVTATSTASSQQNKASVVSTNTEPVVKHDDVPVVKSTQPIVTKSEQSVETKTSKKEKRDYDQEDNNFWYMRAGWNLMKCKGDDVTGLDVQSKSGYQLTWGFEKPMGPLFWGMEFGLGSRGWKVQEEGGYEKTLFSHNGFFSPFNLGYKYDFSEDFAVEAHVGVYASGDYFGKVKESMWSDSDEWNIYDSDGYTYYDIGMQFGFGVWYGKFGCDLLFQKGFVDWQDDMKYQTSNFMIRLGLKF